VRIKIPSFESLSAEGTTGSRKPGRGFVPITLSTAIASGSGVSRVSGAASMLITKMHPICRR
jgi:hypothetical protein